MSGRVERCDGCRFFYVPDTTSSGFDWQRSVHRGECRVRAPDKDWPVVHGDDFCGEYQAREG